MSTGRIWRTESASLEDTLKLAAAIGRKLRGGEVIELVGDLGSGKTAFVKGLALGIGCDDAVRSPSFTLSNQYQANNLTLYHFDFYRLEEPGIMRDELAEILNQTDAVVVIEWAAILQNVLPNNRLTITIKVISETGRNFSFEYPLTLDYLAAKYT